MPQTKIAIIGGGFGGVYTLKYLHKYFCGNKNVAISLISEKNYFLFSPLLHEVATGSINPENIVEPIRKVLGCCLSDFHLGRAEEIDLESRNITVKGLIIPFDYLVLAPGAETNFYNIPGAKENSFTLKSIDDAIAIKNHVIRQMEKATHMTDSEERRKALDFTIVGGGPTGVELVAELEEFIEESFSEYYPEDLIRETNVRLIQKGPELLPQFGKKIREKSLQVLRKKNIDVMLDTEVRSVGQGYIETAGYPSTELGARKIETGTIIWVAGIKPSEIKFKGRDLKRAENGKIIVNENLQIAEDPRIFALGDSAAVRARDGRMLPALAQVASKQAGAVARNIYLSVQNKKLKPFEYRHTGDLISLGQWMAVGEALSITFWGRFTWWIWRTVYLSKLISFRKKVKVAADWTVNLFYPRDISEL